MNTKIKVFILKLIITSAQQPPKKQIVGSKMPKAGFC